MADIKIIKTDKPGTMPDEDKLGFGTFFTDHMFVMDYTTGKGWHSPRIEPYREFGLFPSAMVLHYGQAIFEGIKAFKTVDNRMVVFRTRDYLKRFNRSADILCIPNTDVDVVQEGLFKLLELDKHFLPGKVGTSIYIRPFIIATDPYVGVKVSDTYRLFIILSPSGAYDGELITPALNGSILGGITRRTVLELAREWNMKVSERAISIDEVFAASDAGKLDEAFGSGTAAVISPVGELSWKGRKLTLSGNKTGPASQRLYDEIAGLQYGKIADRHGWVDTVTKL